MVNVLTTTWLFTVVSNIFVSISANWITGNLCWSMPCQNGGSCFGSAYTYLCVCPINYSGALCEKRMGICQESPCGNRGLCVETGLTSFECRCYFDYMGPLCEDHVPKDDPTVWSSLIPVHTRVLFDILQEAYRAKAQGESSKASHYNHIEDTDSSILHKPSSLPSNLMSPSLRKSSDRLTTSSSVIFSDVTETTEIPNIIRADKIELEKIFPKFTTISTSESDSITIENVTAFPELTTGTDLTNTSSTPLVLTNESTSTLFDVSSPTATMLTVENATVDFTIDQNVTHLPVVSERQEQTIESDLMTTMNTDASTLWLKDNNTDEIMFNTVEVTSVNPQNTSDMMTINTDQTSSFAPGTSTSSVNLETLTITKMSNNIESVGTEEPESNGVDESSATMPMTTESSAQIEELLLALNKSENLRSRLLYKLCRQLLSQIFPNQTSNSSSKLDKPSIDISSNSSIIMNQTANAIVSWIQEQLTPLVSTHPSSTALTTSASSTTSTSTKTTTTASSMITSISNLVIEDSPLSPVSLQRLNMDEVLGQMIHSIDGDTIS